ncbi:MAG: phosphatase [Verrucomicrobiae bacterium]|nr:phosphatase [Verrucomicrobiae bacterium]
MAGEYPSHQRSAKARVRLRAYLEAGVNFFLDLTVPGELRSYEYFLYEESQALGLMPIYQRLPIPDAGVPRTPDYMVQILNVIDRAIAERRLVYVHCWGGIGRTGVVVGCYLVRHGMTGEQALQELARLWKTVEKSEYFPDSPETPQQREYILKWREPAKTRRG